MGKGMKKFFVITNLNKDKNLEITKKNTVIFGIKGC